MSKLYFASDYQEGAHPSILAKLSLTNLVSTPGYGTDSYTRSAIQKIREACACPGAQVTLLVGGTQTNATVIDALLRAYQGVLAPDTGHISVHEAGAIEAGGHKVLTLPATLGKISAGQIRRALEDFEGDANHDHMVMPGMVYLSQPTEYGTLYSKAELEEISQVCREKKVWLYVDGARLAYALASPQNDVTLEDLARLCDAFYIGGTKCGALFGEAVVLPDPGLIPHFFTIVKQHGALLAKGRILGVQFEELFTDGLYDEVGQQALRTAALLQEGIRKLGLPLLFESPTNQIFVLVENDLLPRLGERIEYSFWEKADESHTVIRLATSWATREEDVALLLSTLQELLSAPEA